ncbi:MAG: InlB B-repeat-containing protein, partial [Candidatus Methanomethylophilaceae archaeon]|nr:InlB B-repeat-containing protein [Candidatus Methanomethylophilaceae archaeon]
ATKIIGEQTTILKNKEKVESGTSVSFTYVAPPDHQFIGWTKNGYNAGTDETYTVAVTSNITVGVDTRYHSPSDSVTGITDICTPKADEPLYQKWSYQFPVDSSGMFKKGMPSTPLIVDGNVYVRAGTFLYKMSAETGAVLKKVPTAEMSGFYHSIGYGAGTILDYTSKKAYDLDLNEKFTLTYGKVEVAAYHGGFFYVHADGKLYKLDSETGKASTEGAWNNGIQMNWFGIFGTHTSPVFSEGMMYVLDANDDSISINALNLSTGAKATTAISSLAGYKIDDGWLTHYVHNGSGYLFVTGYKSGLFDAEATTSVVASVQISAGGVVSGSERFIIIGKGGIDVPAGGATSAFQVLNGRGYLNVSVPGGYPSGWFMVFDAAAFLNAQWPEAPSADYYSQFLIYKEASKASHGSIVVTKAYLAKTDMVYIYLLPYKSTDQAVYTFSDYAGKVIPGEYVKSATAGYEYGSQAVRVGPGGELIWYLDDGCMRCYASSAGVSYRFLLQDSEGMEWKTAAAGNPVDALKSILDENGTEYTYDSGVFTVGGKQLSIFTESGGWGAVNDMSDAAAFRKFFASTSVSDMASMHGITFYHREADAVVTYDFESVLNGPHAEGRFSATEFGIVVYDGNGGNGVPTDNSEYRAGGTVTVKFDTKPTYACAFAGWSTEPQATDPTYSEGGVTSFQFTGGKVVLYAVYTADSWTYRFDLGGKTAGKYLGNSNDYGGLISVTVSAADPRSAFVKAAEQAYGPGALVLGGSGYITTINGMNGNGGSISSQQDQWGFGDVFFYPVQYVKEGESWCVTNVPIAKYAGTSKEFAVVFQPLTFGTTAVEHTFASADDAKKYESLKTDFSWKGWGSIGDPLRHWSFHIDLGGKTAGKYLGDDKDYGGPADVTVEADTVRDAFVKAVEATYGSGTLALSKSGFITTINGMDGNGGSISSQQDAWGFGDVYYYPVQYVKEGGSWCVTNVPIAKYTGSSRALAVAFQPLTFDTAAVAHTFAAEADTAKYEGLMRDFSWTGWGSIDTIQHNMALTVGENGTATGNLWVSPGGTASFAFTPDSGYIVLDVKVDGVSTGSASGYTIADVRGDHAIAVEFVANSVKYTLTFNSGITVKDSGDNELSSGSQVAPGDMLKVTVAEQEGKTAVLTKTGVVGELPSLKVIGDVDLSVTYQTNKVTVTFNFDNGDADTTRTVDYGGKINMLPNAGKASTATTQYAFDNWTVVGTGEVFTKNTPVKSDLTVKANYTESVRMYSVTYNANTGKGSVPATAKYAYGTEAQVSFDATPQKTAAFLGWDTDRLATAPKYRQGGTVSLTVTENVKLFAIYAMENWSYHFDLGGKIAGHALGDGKDYGGIHEITVRANHPESAVKLAAIGVYGPKSIEINSSGMIKTINDMDGNGGSIAYYSLFYYPIHYAMEDGKWKYLPTESLASYTGDSRSLALAFQPFNFNVGKVAEFVEQFGTEDEKVKYAWLKEAFNWDGESLIDTIQYKISISSGEGGSVGPFSEARVSPGDTATVTVTADSGYTIKDVLLDGVSVGREGTLTIPDVSSNHTVEAEFISKSVPHKVVYDVNCGTGQVPGDATFVFGDTVTVSFDATPSSGADFMGWSMDRFAEVPEFTADGTQTFTITERDVKLYAVYGAEDWRYFFDLGGKIAGICLGDGKDYGAQRTVTVSANNPKSAIMLAAEAAYGPGSLTIYSSGWISEINGMPGSGGGISSKQDSWGYGDVFFYPVQYVKENGAWKVADVPIAAYIGQSRDFALAFQPLTFDGEPVAHTFAADNDTKLYGMLKKSFSWAGWGSIGTIQYIIEATAGNGGKIEPGTVRVSPGGNATLSFSPNPGYEVADVVVNGESKGQIRSYKFEDVSMNQTVSADFKVVTVEAGIKVAPTTATLAKGETRQLTATLTGLSGDVTWSSSAVGTASVDSGGRVTGNVAGTAVITAACGGYTASCTVTVTDSSTKEIEINPSADGNVSQSQMDEAVVKAQNAKAADPSSNPVVDVETASSAVTVPASGMSGLAEAGATLKVTTGNATVEFGSAVLGNMSKNSG